jgi:uncharacterized protein (DUF3084 family)
MKMCWVLSLTLGLLIFAPPLSAADGTFRGRVIDPPVNTPAIHGWIFVQGRNRMLRRVEVSHAVVVFGDEVPASEHRKCNSECLSAGQEVRVTARLDSAGEWRAKRVEILHLATIVAQATPKSPHFTNLNPESTYHTGNRQVWILHRTVYGRNPIRVRECPQRYNERVLKRAPFVAGVCYEI